MYKQIINVESKAAAQWMSGSSTSFDHRVKKINMHLSNPTGKSNTPSLDITFEDTRGYSKTIHLFLENGAVINVDELLTVATEKPAFRIYVEVPGEKRYYVGLWRGEVTQSDADVVKAIAEYYDFLLKAVNDKQPGVGICPDTGDKCNRSVARICIMKEDHENAEDCLLGSQGLPAGYREGLVWEDGRWQTDD